MHTQLQHCKFLQAKKSKEEDDPLCEKFQEFEYPQYDDLRAEAFCHQQKRQECLKKAGEAYRMGMKPVAAFYAHQVNVNVVLFAWFWRGT